MNYIENIYLCLAAPLLVAIGFATFENACYLTQNGSANLWLLLIRGFGTGAMHVLCGVITGFWPLPLPSIRCIIFWFPAEADT